MKRGIDFYYPTPQNVGYSEDFSKHRFSILRGLEFSSVLDIGSGVCYLYDWLKNNGYDVEYDPVDIRKETLEHCRCKTYTEIPDKKYDLVCLFGTVTFNIDGDDAKNREVLLNLLTTASEITNKYIVFSVIRRSVVSNMSATHFVPYSREEIMEISQRFGSVMIDETLDKWEYIVTVTTQ